LTTELCLRNALYPDLVRINEIENLSFNVPWSSDDFELFLGETVSDGDVMRSLFLVCTDSDGDVCGYICARCVLDECEILNVASSPSHRRMGVGRMLMSAVHDTAASLGVTDCYLEVRESNTPARSLYESLGYEAVGVRRCYYRCPIEDAILMKHSV